VVENLPSNQELVRFMEQTTVISFSFAVLIGTACINFKKTDDNSLETLAQYAMRAIVASSDECVICYEKMKRSSAPCNVCGTSVCKSCVVKMYMNGVRTCSVCRSPSSLMESIDKELRG
jgi:hypothetical protein